jgi:dTDP-4-dehydrorhamnose reductase
MKLLVAGSRGQLGSKVVELAQGRPGWDVTALDHTALDVTREADVHKAVRQAQPDWVINCTAYNDVEKAESDSDQVHLVNDVAVGYLADAALAGGARLVHVSTDYVFSGDFSGSPPRPYRETDPTAPLGAYGRSKLAGEERLTAHPVGSIVLRTSWVYGGPGKNFVETMIAAGEDAGKAGRSVRVVYDQESTPTDAWSLATQVLRLLSEDVSGIFHASSVGAVSRFDFVTAIYELTGTKVRVEPVRLEEFPSKARRPHYSVLENKRLDDLGINVMPPWKDGLRQAWRRIQARRSGTDG